MDMGEIRRPRPDRAVFSRVRVPCCYAAAEVAEDYGARITPHGVAVLNVLMKHTDGRRRHFPLITEFAGLLGTNRKAAIKGIVCLLDGAGRETILRW